MVALELLIFGPLISYRSTLSIFLGILSLQSLHVVITYLGLLFVPEFKDWVRIKSKNRPARFWMKISALTLGFFALFFMVSNKHYHSPLTPDYLIAFVVLFTLIATLHHRMSQTYGISLAYSQKKIELKPRDTKFFLFEKWGFISLFLCVVFLYCTQLPLLSRVLEQFGIQFAKPIRTEAAKIFLGLALFAGSIIIISSLIENYKRSRSYLNFKSGHLMRTLLYPFSMLSTASLVAVECLHGIEYALVWKKMKSNSNNKSFMTFLVITVSLLMISLFYFVTYVHEYWRQIEMKPSETEHFWLRIAMASNMAITYTHFYLDRQIFRMRDKDTRAVTGKLLNS